MRVFISHHSSDNKFATELREQLVAAGMDVWNPETQLEPGSNWMKEAGRALERADAIIFLLSERALSSAWVHKEIDYALTTKRLANRVYPLLIEDDIEVPWILREIGVVKTHGSAKFAAKRVSRLLDKPLPLHGRNRLAATMFKRLSAMKGTKSSSVSKRKFGKKVRSKKAIKSAAVSKTGNSVSLKA